MKDAIPARFSSTPPSKVMKAKSSNDLSAAATVQTVARFRKASQVQRPIYESKPYVVLSSEDVVLFAGTKAEVCALDSYYDDCRVEVRDYDLHMNDNTRLPAPTFSAEYGRSTNGDAMPVYLKKNGVVVAEMSPRDNSALKAQVASEIVRGCNGYDAVVSVLEESVAALYAIRCYHQVLAKSANAEADQQHHAQLADNIGAVEKNARAAIAAAKEGQS